MAADVGSNPFSGRIIRNGDGPVSVASVPNLITVARILAAPVFFWLVLVDAGELGTLRWVAAIVFIVAIASDGIDGHIARSRNLVSRVGIILDPIADKLITSGALVCLSLLGELWWWVTIVILVREFGITVYRFLRLRDVAIPAAKAGKIKTLVQAVAISAMLLPLWTIVGDWYLWLCWVLMGAALVLTVTSGISFIVSAVKATRAS